jgi:hypothetical protein
MAGQPAAKVAPQFFLDVVGDVFPALLAHGREEALEVLAHDEMGYDCGCILLSCNDLTTFNGAVIFSEAPGSAFIQGSTFRHVAGHGVTRGWVGTAGPDFVAGNTFEDVSGSTQTRPWIEGQSCPDPKPACPEDQ